MSGSSNRKMFLQIFVQFLAFDQPFGTYPQNEFTLVIVRKFSQFVDSNSGISRCFFQSKIAFFPNGNFFSKIFSSFVVSVIYNGWAFFTHLLYKKRSIYYKSTRICKLPIYYDNFTHHTYTKNADGFIATDVFIYLLHSGVFRTVEL